ncbi:transcription-repair coupling factor [Candidatus Poribacteria bacterium]|nr:transcription-repair coupling factor [Candidatus Poribacteria bacterium]
MAVDLADRNRGLEAGAARATEVIRGLLGEHSPVFASLVQELAKGKRPAILHNLDASALALVTGTLAERLARPIVLLTAGVDRAEQLTDDLQFFGAAHALHYPKWEVLPYDTDDLSIEVTAKHLDVFESLSRARRGAGGKPPLIVAPVDAMMQRVLPAERLDELTVRLEWGGRVNVAALVEQLHEAGYEREALVESRGEYSVRGSIIDFYPPNAEDPIRIDLFGDEIESIRHFDPVTQRSTGDLGTGATIAVPAVRLKHQIEEHLRGGGKLASFPDLLPADTIILMDSPERYEEVCAHFESAVDRQYFDVLHEESDLGSPDRLILPGLQVHRDMERFRRVEHTRLPVDTADKSAHRFVFDTGGHTATSGDLDSWIAAIRRRQGEDYLVVIVCDNDGQVQRFEEVLRDHEISARPLLTEDAARGYKLRDAVEGYRDVLLIVGSLQEGFLLHDARVALVTDREIFARYKRRHVYKKIYKGRPVASSGDILRGDYVVHVEHGIGKYMGMRQQQIDGRTVDLLELLYQGGDKLLVPVEKIRFVQKYSSGEGEEPALDRLGTGKWQKRRQKSSEEIEKMAQALLELYAKREVAQRKPFGPDNVWQAEFESSFAYQETPDQLKAIMEAKLDLERFRPMDRLLCGDVGYGKTEVAIRTVFKCVQEGRQAAVLVPTTILALQHHNSFKERFADYPIRVELLSRFQKPAQATEIKKGLKSGDVHVVIGTHKLLAKDMQFLDLGLLVVDEEQRFGVKAKERLKEMRAEVDILTMTATPIPRTLHMALAGLRDLSVITTPPPDRHPIKTRIIHWEEELIAEAILRELNRGGQVFFIHNRVHNIAEVAREIERIVPHARVGIAHGQMREDELEDHMLKFISGDYDILVSTTIVESGIDIQNANTIIVNRADAFGLAQLYQLRGRVGREHRRAYAYLIVPRGQAITETAIKRLAAIEEFTELGSGFNIAMRDMEIRGTGNLLGKEQHGMIQTIGFELYCEMLQDAVSRLRGDQIHDQHDVEIKWPISSFIPAPYVPVETQRVNFYKRLALMRTQEDVEDLALEMRDRFGALPEPVSALLEITRLRLAAARLRVGLIDGSGAAVRLTLIAPEAQSWARELSQAKDKTAGVVSARPDGVQTVHIGVKADDSLSKARIVRELLNNVHDAMTLETSDV